MRDEIGSRVQSRNGVETVADEGRLIAGRYRLRRHIGRGGMGVVWKADDERLRRTVAVKRLLSQPGLSPKLAEEARQRAMREGRMAARLQHPGAVAIHDVIDDQGQPALVMEYLPGHSLSNVVRDGGALPPAEVARIGAQVAGALATAHAAGIVHRDVKPANVLLTDDGTVKITDFGISWAADEATITQTGTFPGTPAYLSPEVANGQDSVPASDVFSLGSTLYAAVEGQPPFGEDGNSLALLHAVAAGNVPPPQQAGELTNLLGAMLSVDPAARPTMEQIAETLRALVEGRESPADSPAASPFGSAAVRPLSATAGKDASAENRSDATRPMLSRRGRYVVAGIALLAVLAGALLIGQYLATDEPGLNRAGRPASPADLERAAADYYALLPQRSDEAWTRLGHRMRETGKPAYTRFWGTVRNVQVIAPPRATGKTVLVGVELVMADRSRSREFHQHGMIQRDGEVLIGSDQIVHSEKIPAPPPAGQQDNQRADERQQDDADDANEKRNEQQEKLDEQQQEKQKEKKEKKEKKKKEKKEKKENNGKADN